MTLSPLNVVQQIPQETKHRDNASSNSCSTSNNSCEAQDFNIPVMLVNSLSHTTQNSKQGLKSQYDTPLFIVELGMQNSQLCQWF